MYVEHVIGDETLTRCATRRAHTAHAYPPTTYGEKLDHHSLIMLAIPCLLKGMGYEIPVTGDLTDENLRWCMHAVDGGEPEVFIATFYRVVVLILSYCTRTPSVGP